MREAAFPRISTENQQKSLEHFRVESIVGQNLIFHRRKSGKPVVELAEIIENLNMSVPAVRPSASEQLGRVDCLSRPHPDEKFLKTSTNDGFSDVSKHPAG